MEIHDICDAQKRLKSVLRPTHLIRSGLTDDFELYLKPENLQITGSFKLRGAYNKLACLSEEEKRRGVVACSAGNHAQGVALAAREAGVRAVICMPEKAPRVKIEATKKLGAEVVLVPGVYDDAYEKALDLQKEQGLTFVHPFNDEAVIAGQGTIALEILADLPEVDAVLCAVGGGGLLAGIAYTLKTLRPGIRVYGVQSVGAPGMFASMAAGYVKRLETVRTFADGIAVKEVGNVAFDYVRRYVDDIFTVSDEEIIEAMRLLMNKEKLVSEGAGGAPLAAVLGGHVPGLTKESKVVTIISGGNIDVDFLCRVLMEGV